MKRIVRMGRGVKARRAGVKEIRSFLLQQCAGKKKERRTWKERLKERPEDKD